LKHWSDLPETDTNSAVAELRHPDHPNTQILFMPPLDDRIYIKIYMGQGVTAPMENVIMMSGDSFQTCSSVVMYNHGTRRGGYYHYPAGVLTRADGDPDFVRSRTTLQAMQQNVQPTEIHVLTPKTLELRSAFTVGIDIDELEEDDDITANEATYLRNLGAGARAPASCEALQDLVALRRTLLNNGMQAAQFSYDGQHGAIFVTQGLAGLEIRIINQNLPDQNADHLINVQYGVPLGKQEQFEELGCILYPLLPDPAEPAAADWVQYCIHPYMRLDKK